MHMDLRNYFYFGYATKWRKLKNDNCNKCIHQLLKHFLDHRRLHNGKKTTFFYVALKNTFVNGFSKNIWIFQIKFLDRYIADKKLPCNEP